jgi:hypothetical protein
MMTDLSESLQQSQELSSATHWVTRYIPDSAVVVEPEQYDECRIALGGRF